MARPGKSAPPSSPLVLLLLFLAVSAPFLRPAAAGQPINVIVVLVMENRSFDHMLGWMNKDLNATFDGLTGKECNHRSTKDPNSPVTCVSDDAQYVDPDPGHSFQATRDQVFGFDAPHGSPATMAGFVEQAASMSEDTANTVMKGFKPSNVPVYAALAQEFAVFDRWFASIPGPTQPNRLFVYSGTSHGATSHDPMDLVLGYPQRTIFENLRDNGLDFGIYFQSAPATLLYRNMRDPMHAFNFHSFETFEEHARDGKLPHLTVLEPRYFDVFGKEANDDHPSHDVANGQKLVKFVYETLRASPQWNETLLLITYDEHGGFYDHVPTPTVGVPSPDGIVGPEPFDFDFKRLGVRVPTIAVSPWIKKGTVVNKPNGPTPTSEYEHSSVPATIKKMYNLSSDFLTHRDAWAGTFESVVGELTEPRTDCPETLPDVPPLRVTQVDENRPVSEFQSEIVQLAAVLNGDHRRLEFSDEAISRMTVKEADTYVESALDKFLETNRRAAMKGRKLLSV